MKLSLSHFYAVWILVSLSISSACSQSLLSNVVAKQDIETIFKHPPESAKPGVLWMWMGSNISKEGITKGLEALKEAGFNRTTMFSLADITTPWGDKIKNSPTPEIIAWTEPWWRLVRFAAEESKRLHMDFGMFNCPGYTASGGPWIKPEQAMKEICFSSLSVSGSRNINVELPKPVVDKRANMMFPVYNLQTGLVEKPEITARDTFYKDIDVIAVPAIGTISKQDIIVLTGSMNKDGKLAWSVPAGEWIIYRFGYTIMGSLIQPAQPEATGFECDKMSEEAVSFHMDYVLEQIRKHLGSLVGDGFNHLHFDSYEAGIPTWTPAMKEEFAKRRGYDLTFFLPVFAGRNVISSHDSLQFRNDFDATVKDLYRDVYFTTISIKLKQAHLRFVCEPYGGPWRQDDIMPMVQDVMTEFWTHGGNYDPYELEPTVAALRKSGQNIIEAEAFTGDPSDSKWDETPEWLKPIGDAAFCAGVNRFVLHRFVQQPWSNKYLPGATMGRWGTHFDRTQTWWKPAKALFTYWQRCQALLQWGSISSKVKNDFTAVTSDSLTINFIHRKQEDVHIYFVANTSRRKGKAVCNFKIAGLQPEIWDPVSATMRALPQFKQTDSSTEAEISFDKAQSYFIVFRHKIKSQFSNKQNFLQSKNVYTITGSWKVIFDSAWGGPSRSVMFDTLQDWTLNASNNIRYYSGTAVYNKTFRFAPNTVKKNDPDLYLDLGTVKHIAHVYLNKQDLGIVWTAPWHIKLPPGILQTENTLRIEVTNVWANRLIGDEQQPDDCEWLPGYIDNGKFLKAFPDWFVNKQQRPSKGRYCFTTWKYFAKDSPLVSSGLLGPVSITGEE